MRFTQPNSFNDPFETLPYLERLARQEEIAALHDQFWSLAEEGAREQHGGLEEAYHAQIEEVITAYGLSGNSARKLKAFKASDALSLASPIVKYIFQTLLGLENEDMRKQAPETLQRTFSSQFGTLSLTETPSNLLMWSHYASSHKGFVIGFDTDQGFFKEDVRSNTGSDTRIGTDAFETGEKKLGGYTVRFGKVRYVKTRPEFPPLDSSTDEDCYVRDLIEKTLMTKSEHWNYEREWRLVKSLDGANQSFEITDSSASADDEDTHEAETVYLFDFPQESVVEIIYGCRSSENLRRRVADAVEDGRYADVQIFQARVDDRSFGLNLHQI